MLKANQKTNFGKAPMEHSTLPFIGVPVEVLDAVTSGIDYSDNSSWIPWAWAVLTRANDVPLELDEDEGEYPAHVITFAALGSFYERFQEVYSGIERDDDELMMELLGTYRPYITDIDVARYCERHGYFSSEDLETGDGLLQEAVRNRRVEVKFRLREILGDSRLFTSLVVAGRPAPEPMYDEDGELIEAEPLEDPFAEDAFDSHVADVTSDLSGEQPRTYEWLVG